MALVIYTGARGSRFVCDTNGGFGDAVSYISIAADAPIISCAREQAAEPLLRRLGKMSQRELYQCAQAKKATGACPDSCGGNCNPANPPGQSTHERYNDGVAYAWWPARFRIPVWARGIDVQRDRVAAFCAEARGQGYTVTLTYPGSPNESQHVNFRKAPKISLWKIRPWHPGDGGRRGKEITGILRTILDPQTRRPYLLGSGAAAVELAVKAFQRDHAQKPDGIVGVHTIRALRAVKRRSPHLTSKQGVDMVKVFEGFRATAYRPVKGDPWTIGYGTTAGVHEGMTVTRDVAEKLLKRDLARFEPAVRAAAPWVTQRQFDALVSAVYNLGPGVLEPGRSLGDALATKDPSKVAAALLLYDQGGVPLHQLEGLRLRREAEARAFA